MSQYSDAQAAQMSRAEEGYLREPDEVTDEEQEPPDHQFLGWDAEIGVWRLMSIGQISQDSQDAHYSGYGPVEHLMVLSEPVRGDAATNQPIVRSVKLVQVGATETDSDDYMHTSYELRGEAGELFGAFTTRIDGRS